MTGLQGSDAAGSGTSLAVALPAAASRSDLIVYTMCASAVATSVTGADATPEQATFRADAGNVLWTEIYYIKNCRAGVTNAVTRNTAATADMSLTCEEYAGADLSAPLDQVADAAGTGTAATVTTGATGQANELVVGATGADSSIVNDITSGAGYTERLDTAADFGAARPLEHEDKTVTATGAQTANSTLVGGSANWQCLAATFKEAPHLPITFVNIGISSAVASGNMTPINPQALAINDILVCCLSQHDNVVATMPAGWTRIIAANNTVNCRLDTWWKRVTSPSESGASVTVTRAAGDSGLAQIASFRNVIQSGTPWEAAATTNNVGPTATCTAPSVTPFSTDRMCVFVGVIDDDGAFTTFTGTDPVPVEQYDELTGLGLDASLCIDTGIRAAATATGARTSTNGRSLDTIGATILLIPSTVPEPPPVPKLKTRPFPYKPGSPAAR